MLRLLPPGATINPSEAMRIAKDSKRLKESFLYWSNICETANVDNVFEFTSDYWSYALALPKAKMKALVPHKQYIYDGLHSRNKKYTSITSGCLMSALDITQIIEKNKSISNLISSVVAFKDAAIEIIDNPKKKSLTGTEVKKIANGIRAVREIFDSMRRFNILDIYHRKYLIGMDEALALFYQESGYIISPPVTSFPHAPLIYTKKNYGACRIYATDWEADNKEYPHTYNMGYVNSMGIPYSHRKVHKNHLILKFAAYHINHQTGMDIFASHKDVSPNSSHKDELKGLIQKGIETPGNPLNDVFKKYDSVSLNSFQTRFFRTYASEYLLGIAIVLLNRSGDYPKLNDFCKEVADFFDRIMQSHSKVLIKLNGAVPNSNSRIYMMSDDNGSDSLVALEGQIRWYSVCSKPYTLLAHDDYAERFDKISRFSPYITYMRFNLGETIFTGVLLRTIISIDKVKSICERVIRRKLHIKKLADIEKAVEAWKKSGSIPGKNNWYYYVLDAINSSKWEEIPVNNKRLLKLLEKDYRKLPAGRGEAWRYIGLHKRILGIEKISPNTFSLTGKKTAYQCVDLIQRFDLLKTICGILEYLPITTIHCQPLDKKAYQIESNVKILPATRREPPYSVLLKSHNFENKRYVFNAALSKVSMEKAILQFHEDEYYHSS